MTVLVETRNLALPGRLQPISLRIAAGQLVALVGPNGSGKTSLLHAMAGIGDASGATRIDGADPRRAAPGERARLLSFLPATRELHWPLPARDLVLLGGAEPQAAEAAIARLDLKGVAARRADRLSTGERNRVLLARALATAPRLLLLDEPTANLDPLWQIRVMEMLRESVAAERQAALVAIHDLDSAARFADRLLLMADGRIVADGAPAEILETPLIAQVFGIARVGGQWRPAISPRAEDPRSSP